MESDVSPRTRSISPGLSTGMAVSLLEHHHSSASTAIHPQGSPKTLHHDDRSLSPKFIPVLGGSMAPTPLELTQSQDGIGVGSSIVMGGRQPRRSSLHIETQQLNAYLASQKQRNSKMPSVRGCLHAARGMQWCRLTVVIPITILLATLIVGVVVGVMLMVAANAVAQRLADDLTHSLQETAAHSLCAALEMGVDSQELLVNCIQDDCVADFIGLLYLVMVAYRSSGPSLFMLTARADDITLLPVGVDGQVAIYNEWIVVSNTSDFNEAIASSASSSSSEAADPSNGTVSNVTNSSSANNGGVLDAGSASTSVSCHFGYCAHVAVYDFNLSLVFDTDNDTDFAGGGGADEHPIALDVVKNNTDVADSEFAFSNRIISTPTVHLVMAYLEGNISLSLSFVFPIFDELNSESVVAEVAMWYHTRDICAMLLELKLEIDQINVEMAMVLADGSLVAASIADALFPTFGDYRSVHEKYHSITSLSAIPILSVGGKALLNAYGGNLSRLSTSAARASMIFAYGDEEKGILSASFLSTCVDSELVNKSPMYFVAVVPWMDVMGGVWRATMQSVGAGVGCVVAMAILAFSFTLFGILRPVQRTTELLRRLAALDFAAMESSGKAIGRGPDSPAHSPPGSPGSPASPVSPGSPLSPRASIVSSTPSVLTEIQDIERTARQLEQSLTVFAKFLPRTVVKLLLRASHWHQLRMEPLDVSIYFSDIAGFTSIAESVSAQVLDGLLQEYLREMCSIIIETHGTIDKFIGDAIMAFWNAPDPVPQYAHQAVLAAVRCQYRLAELRKKWEDQHLPELHIRIGVNCGEVLVGNYGCVFKMDFTIIGDAVNLASRLEGLNKKFGTSILLSEAIHGREDVCTAFCCRELGRVAVKGKTEWGVVYEVVGESDTVSERQKRAVELYKSAIHAFYDGHFESALRFLEEYAGLRDDMDTAATELKHRCAQLVLHPPPSDPPWTGVETLHEKF